MTALLTRQDVEEIAYLARLELDSHEIESFQQDLVAILDSMEALKAVDTEGIEPMTHAVPMELRLRPDIPEPSLPVEVALRGAPEQAEGHFQVPSILQSSTGE